MTEYCISLNTAAPIVLFPRTFIFDAPPAFAVSLVLNVLNIIRFKSSGFKDTYKLDSTTFCKYVFMFSFTKTEQNQVSAKREIPL